MVLALSLLLVLQTPPLPGASASDADALYARAVALAGEGEIEQAAGLLERAAAIDEALGEGRTRELARTRAVLGECHSALGRTDAAIADVASAVELWRARGAHAETVGALDLLGRVEFAHGRLEPARRVPAGRAA